MSEPVQDNLCGYVKYSLEIANPGGNDPVRVEGRMQICDRIRPAMDDAILQDVMKAISSYWASCAWKAQEGRSP